MLTRLRRHLTFANVGVVVALVLAGGGFAAAAIPGRDGVIHGCFNKRTGGLRVIDAGRPCTRRERPLNWNQKGKPGVTGATGRQGQPGSDAQFNGAAAGGDLAGSYPSPTVRPGAISGIGVAANSLTGTQIDESTLGQVPDAAKLGGVSAFNYARGSGSGGGTSVPGSFGLSPASGISIAIICTNTPSTGNQISVSNSGGSDLEVFIDDSRNLTPTPYTAALASGSTVSTDVDTATNTVRRLIISTDGGGHGPTMTIITVVRRSGQNFCSSVERHFA